MTRLLLALLLALQATPAPASPSDAEVAALAEWGPRAEAGDVGAQRRLGEIYRDGAGVWRDFEKAAYWFGLAAAQGDIDAQHELGYIHYLGFLVPRDDAAMVQWIGLVAERGRARAQITYGAIFEYGAAIVPVDLIEAHKWYSLAEARGARDVRDLATQARARVEAKMTPEEIAAADRRARAWTPKTK